MNKHTLTSTRVAKLLTQYKTHGSLVIGVDFDFTIYDPTTDTIHKDLVDLLLVAQSELDCILCLWTANNSRIPFIMTKCCPVGLYFDHHNCSPILIEPGVVKPHFSILLDDTAGLGQAIEILEQTIKQIKEPNEH